MKIKTKRRCAGSYTYSAGQYEVDVYTVDPNPAFGDTKEMWMAAALWTSDTYTDPCYTKREAVECAKAWLKEKMK